MPDKQRPAQGIGGRALRAPIHKLLDVPDLKAGFFETLDHAQGLDFGLAEFADAGYALHPRSINFMTARICRQAEDGGLAFSAEV